MALNSLSHIQNERSNSLLPSSKDLSCCFYKSVSGDDGDLTVKKKPWTRVRASILELTLIQMDTDISAMPPPCTTCYHPWLCEYRQQTAIP